MSILLPDYEKSKLYTDECRWFAAFTPDCLLDYKAAVTHATTRHREMVDRFAALDRKAEWMFTTAVATIGGLFLLTDKLNLESVACFPSVLILLVGACMCLRVRWPIGKPDTYSVRDTISGIDQKLPAEAWLAASYHCSIVGYQFITAWKARQVAYASTAGILAIVLFVAAYLRPALSKVDLLVF